MKTEPDLNQSKSSAQPGVQKASATDQTELQAELKKLSDRVAAAEDKEKRALADYQNLVRRTQEERSRLVKLAGREFASSLLQPLDHLSLAAAQLQDKGLDMVVQQFWKTLQEQGLEEMELMNQPFDPELMEVVDKQGEGDTVQKVIKKGYRLNGDVIQVAQVVIG
jgi:molecular chaperone GrpE